MKRSFIIFAAAALLSAVPPGADGQSRTMEATVQSVDAAAMSITVTNGAGERAQFVLDRGTAITRADKRVPFSDIAVGDAVTVGYACAGKKARVEKVEIRRKPAPKSGTGNKPERPGPGESSTGTFSGPGTMGGSSGGTPGTGLDGGSGAGGGEGPP